MLADWGGYEAELARLRALPTASGGDFYLTMGLRVSKRFARALVVSTLEGRASFAQTSCMLGVENMPMFNDLGQCLDISHL